MKKYLLFSIIVFSALWVFSSNVAYAATNWYVDNAATGSNNGTSWTNAWQAFANISWGSVAPGDTLYISGGSTSKTYNERLAVGASGTSGNPITIKTGQDAGHNGTVIITVTASPYVGINIGANQYITISGQVGSSRKMRITGCGYSGIDTGSVTNALKLLYLDIDNNGGYGIHSSVKVMPVGWEIAYCNIYDNAIDGIQLTAVVASASHYGDNSIHHNWISAVDDTIEISFGSVDIYENTLGPNICGDIGHPDVVVASGLYTKVYNNLFTGLQQPCPSNRINAGIYINQGVFGPIDDAGHFWVYNNVFYEPSPTVGNMMNAAITITLGKVYPLTTLTDCYILNNIVAGHKNAIWNVIYGGGVTPTAITNYYIENNIVYKEGTPASMRLDGGGNFVVRNHGEAGANSVFSDYNDFYNTNFPAAAGSHGSNANPNLDSNHKPQPGSWAIDHGFSWASLFTTDKTGTARPQGPSWDIGAYEYTGSSPSPTPTPSPSPPPTGTIEAESGSLVSPMQIVSDNAASGGSYIRTNIIDQGTASYNFNIANDSVYKIIARVYVPDGASDSFYFKIDSQAEDTWDLNPLADPNQFNVWREDEITKRGTGTFDAPQYDPYTVNLTAGNHTLTFRGRETNARLDYFYLVKITDTTPPAAPTGLAVI